MNLARATPIRWAPLGPSEASDAADAANQTPQTGYHPQLGQPEANPEGTSVAGDAGVVKNQYLLLCLLWVVLILL